MGEPLTFEELRVYLEAHSATMEETNALLREILAEAKVISAGLKAANQTLSEIRDE